MAQKRTLMSIHRVGWFQYFEYGSGTCTSGKREWRWGLAKCWPSKRLEAFESVRLERHLRWWLGMCSSTLRNGREESLTEWWFSPQVSLAPSCRDHQKLFLHSQTCSTNSWSHWLWLERGIRLLSVVLAVRTQSNAVNTCRTLMAFWTVDISRPSSWNQGDGLPLAFKGIAFVPSGFRFRWKIPRGLTCVGNRCAFTPLAKVRSRSSNHSALIWGRKALRLAAQCW